MTSGLRQEFSHHRTRTYACALHTVSGRLNQLEHDKWSPTRILSSQDTHLRVRLAHRLRQERALPEAHLAVDQNRAAAIVLDEAIDRAIDRQAVLTIVHKMVYFKYSTRWSTSSTARDTRWST